MRYVVDRVLIERDRIRQRVRELGMALASDLQRELEAEGHVPEDHPNRIVLVPVLTGAMVFAADLVREMQLLLSIRLVAVSSYPGESTKSKGAKLRGALPTDLAGRHIVIIDDILDSGQTLALLRDAILEQKPASLRSVMLLRKDVPRDVDVEAEYSGFDIPDEFVVGYGLDYDGYYRNLPDIVALREAGG
ncbi:MAG: hypoxanthine phosphoribosyltransferase [Planctomycetota bacterium]